MQHRQGWRTEMGPSAVLTRRVLRVQSGLALLLASLAPVASYAAPAIEFRAVAAPAAVLYDAPSAKSTRVFVVNRGYPLEVIVRVEGWTKVRDATGAMAWIDNNQITDKPRTVMIRVPVAQVRQKPDDDAPIAFQAQQSVILELVEHGSSGWVQVRHHEGGTGFVRAQQIWGA
jgi:SH3-like domain-containing protein